MYPVARSISSTLVGVTLLGAALAAQARDLTVISWGGNFQDAQREIYFKPFATLTGQRVLDQSWDGGIGILETKTKVGTPPWDVVEVEAEDLALGCEAGIYEPIDWNQVGNRADFLPGAVSDCGVGAMVWSTGLTYDASRLTTAPSSWADFWDVKKFPGKRGLRKGPKYALEIALMADGVAPADVYKVLRTPEGVDRAFNKLNELKPNLVWWEAGAQSLQLLSANDVVMTSAYNGRISGFNRNEGRNFKLVWPGSIYAIDSWVVLKGTPNKDAAMRFIGYASQPENQAKLPPFIAYGPTNTRANDLIPAELREELPTTPANLAQSLPLDVDFWVDNIENLNQRFNAWIAQ